MMMPAFNVKLNEELIIYEENCSRSFLGLVIEVITSSPVWPMLCLTPLPLENGRFSTKEITVKSREILLKKSMETFG